MKKETQESRNPSKYFCGIFSIFGMLKALKLTSILTMAAIFSACNSTELAPKAPIKEISTPSQRVAYVITYENKVIRISDSGAQVLETSVSSTPWIIHFLDETTGWVLDKEGHLWNTEDGGNRWVDQGRILPELSSVSPEQIYFSDKNNGWLKSNLILWSTNDGGVTWKNLDSDPTFADLEKSIPGTPKGFIAVGDKLLLLEFSSGNFLKTTDRGASWEKIQTPRPEELSSISCFDPNSCWITYFEKAAPAKLYFTNDSGKTWSSVSFDDESSNVGVLSSVFLSDDVGWIVLTFVLPSNKEETIRTDWKVFSTRDGGVSWDSLETKFPDKKGFRYISFSDEQNGWLASNDKVYQTRNGGISWDEVFDVNEGVNNRVASSFILR